jgi:hypothetical protein
MADDRDPPPLFNNVDIEQRDDDNEDLFSSAIDVVNCLLIPYICMILSPSIAIINWQKDSWVMWRVGKCQVQIIFNAFMCVFTHHVSYVHEFFKCVVLSLCCIFTWIAHKKSCIMFHAFTIQNTFWQCIAWEFVTDRPKILTMYHRNLLRTHCGLGWDYSETSIVPR